MLHIDYAYCNTLVFVRHYHIDPITAPAPHPTPSFFAS